MAIRSVAIVNRSRIAFAEVRQVANAIQRQVLENLEYFWGHSGSVIALEDGEAIPSGFSAVYLYDSLNDSRLGGIHYFTDRGEIYANVATNVQPWSLSASHEVLEMIVDPSTDMKWAAPAIGGAQGTVEYLVEICDPCQHLAFSYKIDGVILSDFYTRNYFDLSGSPTGRYSMHGSIKRPLEILPGGYISWRDAQGTWWRGTDQGAGSVRSDKLAGFLKVPGDSVREKIDFLSATWEDVGPYITLAEELEGVRAKKVQDALTERTQLHKVAQLRRREQIRHHQTVSNNIRAWKAPKKKRT